MKRILITGADSYIGMSFESHAKKNDGKYQINTIDMKDVNWKEYDFSEYDTVFHVAGIAHVSSDASKKDLYYAVNSELAIETAKTAKEAGVGQFVFMSSIIVYSDSQMEKGLITYDTVPKCDNFYGDSKIQAEKGLEELRSNDFNIVILRPPMIYGINSKGNFPRLMNFAKKAPFFPKYENKRSMLHIDNLCEFIRLMIDNNEDGVFYPQNKEYVNTSELVKIIGKEYGRNIHLTRIFNWGIKLFINRVNVLRKVFGNLMYDKSMSEYKDEYQIRTLEESIKLSVAVNSEDK